MLVFFFILPCFPFPLRLGPGLQLLRSVLPASPWLVFAFFVSRPLEVRCPFGGRRTSQKQEKCKQFFDPFSFFKTVFSFFSIHFHFVIKQFFIFSVHFLSFLHFAKISFSFFRSDFDLYKTVFSFLFIWPGGTKTVFSIFFYLDRLWKNHFKHGLDSLFVLLLLLFVLLFSVAFAAAFATVSIYF